MWKLFTLTFRIWFPFSFFSFLFLPLSELGIHFWVLTMFSQSPFCFWRFTTYFIFPCISLGLEQVHKYFGACMTDAFWCLLYSLNELYTFHYLNMMLLFTTSFISTLRNFWSVLILLPCRWSQWSSQYFNICWLLSDQLYKLANNYSA